MAKYLVTSGSYFEPFTYDELAKPVAQAAEIHRTTQDAYDAINDDAEALRRYLEIEPENSDARRMYDNYMTKLSSLQNNLWSNGYNSQTRRDLSAARSGYKSDIMRLATAIETRQKRSDEYWDMKHKAPDLITGADPGKANLDEYLKNDRFGQDYYTYSGNQFASEVGTDIKARAAELLRDPRIEKDPMLFGYLTRVRDKGVTNDEINRGMSVIQNIIGNNPENIYSVDPTALSALGLDAPSTMVAQVLLSHLQSSGAAGKVSPEEFNRLVTFGGYGLSQGVMEPDVKDYEDKLATNALERDTWKWKQDYSFGQQLALAAAKKKAEDANAPRPDHYKYEQSGEQEKKADRKTAKYEKLAKEPIVTKDNIPVTNAAVASELVYSGEKRREAAKSLGFDPGLEPDRDRESKFLQGTITDANGKEWQVRYNPKVRYNGQQGFVEVKSGRGQWGIDLDRTKVYRDAVDSIEKAKKYYEENEPAVFNLATIDPKTQARDYAKFNTSFDVPMTEFQAYVKSQPQYGTHKQEDVWIARKGEDPGEIVQRVSDLISSSLVKSNFWDFNRGDFRGAEIGKKPRDYKGNSHFIHELKSDGTLSERSADPDEVFKLNKDKIDNIESVRISPESAKMNCIIVKPENSRKEYAVNIELLGSNKLQDYFNIYNSIIARYDADNAEYGKTIWDSSHKYDRLDELVGNMLSTIGWDNNTQSQGGSHQENPYQ